ncbi:hypothetical protein GCM10010464_81850 [Pseudonocardia yunnanensis]
MASASPVCAPELTSATPDSPHATSERRKANQPAPLGRDDVQANDLAASVGGDADSDQGVHDHGPAALADLLRQRVQPQERGPPPVVVARSSDDRQWLLNYVASRHVDGAC